MRLNVQTVSILLADEDHAARDSPSASVLAALAVVGGPALAASADPDPSTDGCQTVAHTYLEEDAPGHEGVNHAAEQGNGEGPCGFGNPPGDEA